MGWARKSSGYVPRSSSEFLLFRMFVLGPLVSQSVEHRRTYLLRNLEAVATKGSIETAVAVAARNGEISK